TNPFSRPYIERYIVEHLWTILGVTCREFLNAKITGSWPIRRRYSLCFRLWLLFNGDIILYTFKTMTLYFKLIQCTNPP
ncbi:hypothetical protein HHX47_DHR1001708, partial [Lentinula edodes]